MAQLMLCCWQDVLITRLLVVAVHQLTISTKMKTISIFWLTFLSVTISFAEDKKEKPEINLAKDGYPSGHATPEGAACDLARAFINRDSKLFRQTCIKPFGGGENKKAYTEFLAKVAESIDAAAKKDEALSGGPKKISKVYAARHLSLNGPASTGYAMVDFYDIMFVDVEVELVSNMARFLETFCFRNPYKNPRKNISSHTGPILDAKK